MEENNIRKYAGLMRELGLTALEINEDGTNVRLEMGTAQAQAVTAAPAAVHASAPQKVAANEAGVTDVRSPMVGVFYTAPAENAEPYVKVGDKVKKGEVLCIIEAMKLMNEITAECSGTVVEVCAGNNQVVDFGHVLMRLRSEA
jgi:acetyl-CoA carboxylase biotin carboxyl carrier protein